MLPVKKGTELGTEYPSSKRQQRVTRRCAGEPGYLSQKENGQEKTILRGDTEHRGGERDSPAEIRIRAPDKGKCKGKS